MKTNRAWQLGHNVTFVMIALGAIIGAFMLLMGDASAQASNSGQERLSVQNGYYSGPSARGGYSTYQQAAGATNTPVAVTATPMPDCGLYWRTVTSPNAGTSSNYLNGVAAVSADDVWAIGYSIDGGVEQTLTLHYTEGEWTVVPSPNVGTGHNRLNGVAAVSADDVWAVGYYHGSGVDKTLTLHYTNGEWAVVTSPNVGPANNQLNGVAAISSDDVWAVGEHNSGYQTLTLHYTNGEWEVVTSPNVGTGHNYLAGVAAVSADDVWAVGSNDISGSSARTLTLHYTNGEWEVVTSPNGGLDGPNPSRLNGVAGVSADDVWAVGTYTEGGEAGGDRALTLHYTNGQWAVVPSPYSSYVYRHLTGVAAVSADDVWAVGYYGVSGTQYRTLTLHYTNGQWTEVPSPFVGLHLNRLNGVAAVSADDVWAVGYHRPDSDQTLTLHYSDPQCYTATPDISTATNTPLPTQTPGGPSATPIPSDTPVPPSATSTNTAVVPSATSINTPEPTETAVNPSATSEPSSTPVEPTPCTLEYTDVPSTHTFYQFVRCIACRGIVTGYACGGDGEPCDEDNNPYFRPNVSVTRGQIAKIVSSAAGYDEDPGDQVYEDVPSSNVFYQWINRLSMRGHMGGYPCGGEGEPCGVGDLPYFRPFANATRAQLAKIVSNAAGLGDTGAEQIFTDVPPDNIFYAWIQRLASRDIMGGYACGGEGEPCDDQNRPYFRPYNNVTRGQTSKIVAGAFFPNCETP